MIVFATRIPTHFNDGTEIPEELIDEIEFQTWSKFNGLTFGPATVGAWVDPKTGTVHREMARELEVVISPERVEEARKFVGEFEKSVETKGDDFYSQTV